MDNSIKIKLLSNGRYTWEITIGFTTIDSQPNYKHASEVAKATDTLLREKFPHHAMPASGRVVELDD